MSDEGFKEVMEEILFGDNPTQAFDNALKTGKIKMFRDLRQQLESRLEEIDQLLTNVEKMQEEREKIQELLDRRKKNKNFVSGQEKTILRICKVGKFIIPSVGMNG